eukprot:7644179-Karenia_brevis.AAC.1
MVVDRGGNNTKEFESDLLLLEEAEVPVRHAYWLKYVRLKMQDYYQFQKYQESMCMITRLKSYDD